MATRQQLLEELRRKRECREAHRQHVLDEDTRRLLEDASARRIQRVVRGSRVRRRWSDEEWVGLQRQLLDLDKLTQMLRQKGQMFVAPVKIIVSLMIRCVWQRRRAVEELSRLFTVLAALVAAALVISADDAVRSFCHLLGATLPYHAPTPGMVLVRFARRLLLEVVAPPGRLAAGMAERELSEILDAHAWGQGRAMDDNPACRGLANLLLSKTTIGGALKAWHAAALAASASWLSGQPPSDQMIGLVAVASSWLRLSAPNEPVAAELVEVVCSVPRIGALLVSPAQAGSARHFQWALLLRGVVRRLDVSGADCGSSMKRLEREFQLAYLSANLWEVHSLIGLPLDVFLACQARLTEFVELSMLPGAPAHAAEESTTLQALRRQLQPLVDPASVIRLFSQALHLNIPAANSPALAMPGRKELWQAARRPYERHCLAVALMEVSPLEVESLCRIYSVLLLKAWAMMRATRGASYESSVFYTLASNIAYMENGDVARVLWRYLHAFYNWRDRNCTKHQVCRHVLHLQLVVFSQLLSVMSDEDVVGGDGGCSLMQDLQGYVEAMTSLVLQLLWRTEELSALEEALTETLSRVLGQLRAFSVRLPVGRRPADSCWVAPLTMVNDFGEMLVRATKENNPCLMSEMALRLLRYAPQTIPLDLRVHLLRLWSREAREAGRGKVVRLPVRRTHLFEDGLAALEENWNSFFQVIFIDEHGRQEPGQDIGGLFKEFLEKLAETSFNPEYGLFKSTDSRQLCPNPEAHLYHERVDKLFEFLGLVIGKGIFEGIVLEPRFAEFFLSKLQGRHNSYYDLQSLDRALFANLQRLKNYDGNFEDLCCTFVVAAANGEEVPLLPGGKDLPVTKENRFRYIYMLSDYKLNKELQAVSTAFQKGFTRLIDQRWLRLFSASELQQVISGSSEAGVDIEDLKKHVRWSNCEVKDKFLTDFFTVLKDMNPGQLALLLRFVTSCSRVPLLGFAHLVPPFTIHKVKIKTDSEKLPTASTCFNVLKLPAYSNWKVMKQKLEFVINQGAGFELD